MNVLEAARARSRRLYAEGFRDGIITGLHQLLDDPRALAPDGAFKGELPAEVRDWALAALHRAETEPLP